MERVAEIVVTLCRQPAVWLMRHQPLVKMFKQFIPNIKIDFSLNSARVSEMYSVHFFRAFSPF